MVSVFDLEQLHSLLEDFHRITGIRITVFDAALTELVSVPEHCARLCALVRATAQGRAACAACDRQACATAAREKTTHIYRCHAGLTEAVTPLYVGDVLVGYLLFGHVFGYDSPEAGWEEIRRCCAAYPVDPALLKGALSSCTQVSRAYIRSAARILQATASYLVMERMATLRESSPAARLEEYLRQHYAEPITAGGLCRELGISRSRLYRLAEQLYGCGIQQQVRRLRMEKARRLLADCPQHSIAWVAAECGYTAYNYFITVFTRETGESPGSFRRRGGC